MKFSLFDRREQKMKKLATLVENTEDRLLMAVVEQGGTEELALLLRLVPMSRMNPMLQMVPIDRLRDAFAKLKGNARSFDGVTDQAIGSVVALLTTQFAERAGPIVEDLGAPAEAEGRPVCVRALDFAGKVLSDGGN